MDYTVRHQPSRLSPGSSFDPLVISKNFSWLTESWGNKIKREAQKASPFYRIIERLNVPVRSGCFAFFLDPAALTISFAFRPGAWVFASLTVKVRPPNSVEFKALMAE